PGAVARDGRDRRAGERCVPLERAARRMIAWTVACAVIFLLAAQTWRARRAVQSLETRLEATSRSLESLQQAFSRFAPASVVDDIIAQGISTRSEKKEVTVLFADLKGFTALGETLDATVLVRIVNQYFESMSRVITAHGGHVSKFIGDGILA